MPQAFMQVGMQVVSQEAVFCEGFTLRITPDKLFVKAIALRRLVVSLGYILNRNGL